MSRRALVVGAKGQDGYYLSNHLAALGYEVWGTASARRGTATPPDSPPFTRLTVLDLREPGKLAGLIREAAPDEIYYLAAHHAASADEIFNRSAPQDFIQVNLQTPLSMLEELHVSRLTSRVFFASSCQIFGLPSTAPQSEDSPRWPSNLYAISKNAATETCRYYRQHHGVYAAVGILYQHESPRRRHGYVSSTIARAVAAASVGRHSPLRLRNPNAVVDWGAAKDYVKAMHLCLQALDPDEYVIATGSGHTVMEFVEEACSYADVDPEVILAKDTPVETTQRIPYIGDSSKIRNQLGWEPTTSFQMIVHEMVESEILRLTSSSPRDPTVD